MDVEEAKYQDGKWPGKRVRRTGKTSKSHIVLRVAMILICYVPGNRSDLVLLPHVRPTIVASIRALPRVSVAHCGALRFPRTASRCVHMSLSQLLSYTGVEESLSGR